MRIRTIKPEFWANEKLSGLAEVTHMGAAALLNYSDDEGYFNANPGLVKAAIFPLREPSRSVPVILQELSAVGYLRLGTGADGRRYGHIIMFDEHQSISKPRASKIKGLRIVWEPSGTTPGGLPEPSSLEQGTGNREQGREGRVAAPSGAPVLQLVETKPHPPKPGSLTLTGYLAYCTEHELEPIPPDDPVWEYAEKIDLAHELLELTWKEFVVRHREKAKRYRDWPAAFRNCVRDNWYGFWATDESRKIVITSKGRTAQNAHRKDAA